MHRRCWLEITTKWLIEGLIAPSTTCFVTSLAIFSVKCLCWLILWNSSPPSIISMTIRSLALSKQNKTKEVFFFFFKGSNNTRNGDGWEKLPRAGLVWELDTIGVHLQDLHDVWVVGTHHVESHLQAETVKCFKSMQVTVSSRWSDPPRWKVAISDNMHLTFFPPLIIPTHISNTIHPYQNKLFKHKSTFVLVTD